jgi:hypothetical protein
MAEYLTMVEIFFADQKQYSGKIVVPKKLTQSIYAGGFFHRVLGEGRHDHRLSASLRRGS